MTNADDKHAGCSIMDLRTQGPYIIVLEATEDPADGWAARWVVVRDTKCVASGVTGPGYTTDEEAIQVAEAAAAWWLHHR